MNHAQRVARRGFPRHPSCDETNRAARLSGFSFIEILQRVASAHSETCCLECQANSTPSQYSKLAGTTMSRRFSAQRRCTRTSGWWSEREGFDFAFIATFSCCVFFGSNVLARSLPIHRLGGAAENEQPPLETSSFPQSNLAITAS